MDPGRRRGNDGFGHGTPRNRGAVDFPALSDRHAKSRAETCKEESGECPEDGEILIVAGGENALLLLTIQVAPGADTCDWASVAMC
jgi:hypothetical protein